MASETEVATAALAIAIAALVIAFGQLLQQLFGTAEGYRKCQSSVIGDWSSLVSLRLRWSDKCIDQFAWLWCADWNRSSFRFEVKVTTPHFEICNLKDARDVLLLGRGSEMVKGTKLRVAITGSERSRQKTFSRLRSEAADQDEDEDVVSWASLLTALHNRQEVQICHANLRTWIDTGSCPDSIKLMPPGRKEKTSIVCLSLKTRSWDLMPPDVVRPVASTTLGTLISIAHRLGMVWVDLVPREGKLRAEGLGQSFSATLMRGMGIVVEYTREPNLEPHDRLTILRSLRIPSVDSDKMACGIIPGNPLLGTWDIPIRSDQGDPDIELIVEALQDMRVGNAAMDEIRESVMFWNPGHHWPAFMDLFGLWSDWLPLPDSTITDVNSPLSQRIFPMGEVYEARVVWRWLLSQKDSPSDMQRRLLRYYNKWEECWDHFHKFFGLSGNRPEEMEWITYLKALYDSTTSYFTSVHSKYEMYMNENLEAVRYDNEHPTGPLKRNNFYANLVASHIKINAHSLKEADANVNAGIHRNDGRVGATLYDTVFTERAFIYADNVPKVVAEMAERGFRDSDIEDAWWVLMLRMQVWEMSINRVPDKAMKVPSSYYNSPTRVYIL